jgi:hypothetical protein
MLRKLTAKKRWLAGAVAIAVLALAWPVVADGADVSQFKSNGGSASTSWNNYSGDPYNYTQMSAQATESDSGSNRSVYVYLYKYVRVSNATNTGWAYRYRYSYGLAPDPSVFAVSKSTASLDIDADTLPTQYDYSYQYGTNPPAIPSIGDLGQVKLNWKGNNESTYMNTGHTVRHQTVSSTGTTIKYVQSGMQTSSSADVSGTFCGDYASTGSISENKNLTLQVTKE